MYKLILRLRCFTQSVRKQTSWNSQDWRVSIYERWTLGKVVGGHSGLKVWKKFKNLKEPIKKVFWDSNVIQMF